MALPVFGFVAQHLEPITDGPAAEAEWLARCAATGRASAHLWTAPAGWVVPRRYTALPGWRTVDTARVQVRASGGGLVPQGPGVWNLTLAWPAPAQGPAASDAIYRALCAELSAAFARLGISTAPGPVDGAFCDGRYNLAVRGRKLVGTAQAWRRIGGVPLVMAHAVIVVDADPAALTVRANDFEAALGTGTVYRPQALTSVAREVADADDIAPRTLAALAERFAHGLMKG